MVKARIALVFLIFSAGAYGNDLESRPSPTPTSPAGGKNVRTKIVEPEEAKPVGVRAADPSQNGQVDTSGALSPINASSMGLGIQFDLSRPKKTPPERAKKKPVQQAPEE